MTINAVHRRDQAEARGQQLLAALEFMCHHSVVAHRIDPARRAVIGHSMGGAGALLAAAQDPSIRAVVVLAPWVGGRRWPQVRTPTLIIAAGRDRVAPPDVHARALERSLPSSTPRKFVELPGASHYAPLFRPTRAIEKPLVDWLETYVGAAGSAQ